MPTSRPVTASTLIRPVRRRLKPCPRKAAACSASQRSCYQIKREVRRLHPEMEPPNLSFYICWGFCPSLLSHCLTFFRFSFLNGAVIYNCFSSFVSVYTFHTGIGFPSSLTA